MKILTANSTKTSSSSAYEQHLVLTSAILKNTYSANRRHLEIESPTSAAGVAIVEKKRGEGGPIREPLPIIVLTVGYWKAGGCLYGNDWSRYHICWQGRYENENCHAVTKVKGSGSGELCPELMQ